MEKFSMVEQWSAVPAWIAKVEGDWEALEILLTRNSSHACAALRPRRESCHWSRMNLTSGDGYAAPPSWCMPFDQGHQKQRQGLWLLPLPLTP